MDDPTRVIIDTDTAGDDTQAILLALLSDRIAVDALTIVAGNVEFDFEVENAKYTLELADRADDVPVYEGAREPLQKDFEHADYVHGEGGLGGDLFPETGIDSAPGHAAVEIVERARADPGELTLVCIGPLTNVALALRIEPNLGELLESVWVMGGAVHCQGNVTPAAEYNFWVDPDAAAMVLSDLPATLVDWGLSLRASVVGPETFERIEDADTRYAEFFLELTESVREFTRTNQGIDGATQPDSLTVACLAYPELVEASTTAHVAVDERTGLTRGHSVVDAEGIADGEPRTEVIESVDREAFLETSVAMLAEGDPDAAW